MNQKQMFYFISLWNSTGDAHGGCEGGQNIYGWWASSEHLSYLYKLNKPNYIYNTWYIGTCVIKKAIIKVALKEFLDVPW